MTMKMNKFKVRAFFEEFEFLQKIAEAEGAEEVYVKRIDENFLKRVPIYSGATGSLVDITDSEKIFLLDKDGNVLTEVKPSVDIRHNEAHWDDESWDGETVGEAIGDLDNPNEVLCAILIHRGFKIRDHHSIGGYSLTVYKPPKSFTLLGWIKEQERREKQLLSAQLVEIDKV